ncbi:MAG: cyclase family protein [Thermoanaerobaculaceae bacterium]|nr:cyclase family protein [Thermoanaerobaculaceae bacterium]TAM48574.1 MAG: kynurenine formamidase [Acidobacteriota bacterium]
MLGKVIDISRPLEPATAVWPGDTPFAARWTHPHGTGQAAVTCLQFSPHVGTHLDAPLHVVPDGRDVASVPLAACVGRCEVVAVPGHRGPISESHLPAGWSPSTPRILFATGTWPAGTAIPPAFASLAPAFVDFLARAGVVLVGLDTPSVDSADATDLLAHRRCAAQTILVVEGLDLTGVLPGPYTLVAAPLRMSGIEASPVRALLLPAKALPQGLTERLGGLPAVPR